jgi:general secretion pathway protein E
MREWEEQLAQAIKLEVNQAGHRQPARHPELPRRVLQPRALGEGRRAAGQGRLQRDRELRAAGQLGASGKLDANDQHIVHIVDWLLQYAFEQRASDIHLEPRREWGNVRFRIDGVLHQVYQIPTPVMAAMTSRIKVLGRMDVVEKRRPQDGRIKTVTPGRRRSRAAAVDHADRLRREARDAHLRPRTWCKDYRELGLLRRRRAKRWTR